MVPQYVENLVRIRSNMNNLIKYDWIVYLIGFEWNFFFIQNKFCEIK